MTPELDYRTVKQGLLQDPEVQRLYSTSPAFRLNFEQMIHSVIPTFMRGMMHDAEELERELRMREKVLKSQTAPLFSPRLVDDPLRDVGGSTPEEG